MSETIPSQPVRSSGRLRRFVVVFCVVLLWSLAALFIWGSWKTNRAVQPLAGIKPGTPFAEVVAAHGAPDRIDVVQGSWKWGRRMRRMPAGVTRVAVYNRLIAPQVCIFLLDAQDIVVEVDRFAAY